MISAIITDKIQPHTVKIYDLNRAENYTVHTIRSRCLLSIKRFDLFAKLYYIRNKEKNFDSALNVYIQHIKAFNPDLQEPGRDDKVSIEDFITTFNNLIETFKHQEFNDSMSLIPVDKNGVILDGAHRIAALAYFNKNVTIVRFNDVKTKCDFDYAYFMNRGLSWSICDTVAVEALHWLNNIYSAIFCPLSNSFTDGETIHNNKFSVLYKRRLYVNRRGLMRIVNKLDKRQEWMHHSQTLIDKTSRVYGRIKKIDLLLFVSESGGYDIHVSREAILDTYGVDELNVYFSESFDKTLDLVYFLLSEKSPVYRQSYLALIDSINEKKFRLKSIHFLNFKIYIAKSLSSIKRFFIKR